MISTDIGHTNVKSKAVYRIVLTGGPCGGKTTAQARLSDFFENLGWRVYRAPEAANLLLSGGVKFCELDTEQIMVFQEDLLKTLLQIEDTFFHMAERSDKDTLVICDRGAMDPSAYCSRVDWTEILRRNKLVHDQLRDDRYNQVVHLVTAADGAESFYTLENSTCRDEGIEHARRLDMATSNAWVGHPYLDVIDNSTSFEGKVLRVISSVVTRLGLDVGDRLATTSRKRKFLIRSVPEDEKFLGNYQDFTVVHTYLDTHNADVQTRLRKRGSKGSRNFTYLQTIRNMLNGVKVEQKRQLTSREYTGLQLQRDPKHHRIYKSRRCFIWNNQYYQLDIYHMHNVGPAIFDGLIILETYTTMVGDIDMPPFLDVIAEITHDKRYSMHSMSKVKHVAEALAPRARVRLFSQPNLDKLVNGTVDDDSEAENGSNGESQPHHGGGNGCCLERHKSHSVHRRHETVKTNGITHNESAPLVTNAQLAAAANGSVGNGAAAIVPGDGAHTVWLNGGARRPKYAKVDAVNNPPKDAVVADETTTISDAHESTKPVFNSLWSKGDVTTV